MIVDNTRGAREYLHVLPISRKSAIALYVEKGVRAARKRKYFKRTQKRRTHTPQSIAQVTESMENHARI